MSLPPYQEENTRKVVVSRLMRELRDNEGWTLLSEMISESVEALKNDMARGIESEREYWQAVGKIAAYRNVLRKPEELIRKGDNAERELEGASK